MWACVGIYMHTYGYAYIHTYIHTLPTFIYIYIYMCIITYIHTYTHTHTNTKTLFLPCSHKKNMPSIYLSFSKTILLSRTGFPKTQPCDERGLFKEGF